MNNYKFVLRVVFAIAIPIFLITCRPPEQSDSSGEKAVQTLSASNGTAKMIELLREANSKIDPLKVPYYNLARANIFKKQLEANGKFSYYMQFAYELLAAVHAEQAIVEFERMLNLAISAKAPPENLYQVKEMLALSCLRLSESENCIKRYNDESCLMPFKGKGIYSVKEATRTAISIFESMLEEKPEDYEIIWLLNFAYMTLGEHPQKVPRRWLIPTASFNSDYQIPQFPNISKDIGVGTVALAGGACVEDFNNDGLLDIVASSWGPNDQLRLFINEGNGKFSEKTEEAGLTGLTGGLNTNHADYNNDGFTDILVLRGAWYDSEGKIPNSLLRNNGDGTFSDVTIEAGLLSFAPTQAAVWADFDNDGWLDLFIGNESGKVKYKCEFYFNNRDGTRAKAPKFLTSGCQRFTK